MIHNKHKSQIATQFQNYAIYVKSDDLQLSHKERKYQGNPNKIISSRLGKNQRFFFTAQIIGRYLNGWKYGLHSVLLS